jgi:hypothetical protein
MDRVGVSNVCKSGGLELLSKQTPGPVEALLACVD